MKTFSHTYIRDWLNEFKKNCLCVFLLVHRTFFLRQMSNGEAVEPWLVNLFTTGPVNYKWWNISLKGLWPSTLIFFYKWTQNFQEKLWKQFFNTQFSQKIWLKNCYDAVSSSYQTMNPKVWHQHQKAWYYQPYHDICYWFIGWINPF